MEANQGVSTIIENLNSTIRNFSQNKIIRTDDVSDGYHTFGELYAHRIALFIALARRTIYAWRSKAHSDGSIWDGWFILGIYKDAGKQITYHLPMSEWDKCDFAETLEKAPEWDRHTSNDVLERLGNII